jgi:hypothetical protein
MNGPDDIGTWFTTSAVQFKFHTGHSIEYTGYLLGPSTAYILKTEKRSISEQFPTSTRGGT